MHNRRVIFPISCSVISAVLIVISGSSMGVTFWSLCIFTLGLGAGVIGLTLVVRECTSQRADSGLLVSLGMMTFIVVLFLSAVSVALSDLPIKWRWAMSHRSFEALRTEVMSDDGDQWEVDEKTLLHCRRIGQRAGLFYVVTVCRTDHGLQFIIGRDNWGQPRGVTYGRAIELESDVLINLEDNWYLWRSYK
jgi:hypothetical protein